MGQFEALGIQDLGELWGDNSAPQGAGPMGVVMGLPLVS